jgi:hypothetical protein
MLHIHTYMHTYVRIYTHVCTYVRTYMHECVYGDMHTRIRTCVHTHTYIYVYAYVHRPRTYVHTYALAADIHTDVRSFVLGFDFCCALMDPQNLPEWMLRFMNHVFESSAMRCTRNRIRFAASELIGSIPEFVLILVERCDHVVD